MSVVRTLLSHKDAFSDVPQRVREFTEELRHGEGAVGEYRKILKLYKWRWENMAVSFLTQPRINDVCKIESQTKW